MMTVVGKWRLYFNRLGADPLPWCISPVDGLWEIAVAQVAIEVPSLTIFRPKPTADEDDGKPSAWIEAEGQLTVLASGHASIGAP